VGDNHFLTQETRKSTEGPKETPEHAVMRNAHLVSDWKGAQPDEAFFGREGGSAKTKKKVVGPSAFSRRARTIPPSKKIYRRKGKEASWLTPKRGKASRQKRNREPASWRRSHGGKKVLERGQGTGETRRSRR